MRLYVTAMVDFWDQQQRLNINSNPNPRDTSVKELMKVVEYEEDQRKRTNYDDRGVGTLLDGYTTMDQMLAIGNHFMRVENHHGVNLRNWLAFFLSHFALMRGESARKMELPDLHCVRLEKEGISECRALIMVIMAMRQGKTNRFGRVEVGSRLRHKDARLCPHGTLGLYFFWRWQIEKEAFPSFAKS